MSGSEYATREYGTREYGTREYGTREYGTRGSEICRLRAAIVLCSIPQCNKHFRSAISTKETDKWFPAMRDVDPFHLATKTPDRYTWCVALCRTRNHHQ